MNTLLKIRLQYLVVIITDANYEIDFKYIIFDQIVTNDHIILDYAGMLEP